MFYLALAFIGAIVVATLVFASRTADASGDTPVVLDVALYKEQLAEIEADLARGTLELSEAEAMRAEIGRRLIAADRRSGARGVALVRPKGRLGVVLASFLALAGAGLTYWQLGAPTYPDVPLVDRLAAADAFRQSRPSQAAVEAQVGLPAIDPSPARDVVVSLEAADAKLASEPGHLESLVARATALTQMGDFKAAYETMDLVLQVQGDKASAEQWTGFGLLQVYALQGQYVSPQAEAAFRQALAINEAEPMARYYIGLLYAQTDRPDLAFRLWRPLVEGGPPTAPWVELASERIEAAASAAGIRYSLAQGDGLAGPSAEDVEAASTMSKEDQRAMIEAMVSGLSDRLATEGGPPEAWERLIRSLVVLDRQDQARAILEEAERAFATNPQIVQRLASFAASLGLR